MKQVTVTASSWSAHTPSRSFFRLSAVSSSVISRWCGGPLDQDKEKCSIRLWASFSSVFSWRESGVEGEVEGRKWRVVGGGGVWRERTRKGRGECDVCGGKGVGRKGVEEMRAVEE